jgi:ABC-type dipeptide/oligopeptide/nickel transport system ATPase component
MALINELNRSQGTTIVVVTHDLNVARQTHRVLMMADGRIVRDDCIGSPIEEDLKVWSQSELGRAILRGDIASLETLGITPEQMRILHTLFDNNRPIEEHA